MRPLLVPSFAVAVTMALSACGSEGISVSSDSPFYEGAVLFSERCSGCHTLSAAGAEGSGKRQLRVQGPNLDQRNVSVPDAMFAIRNGGFSGAIMPQNIVVGHEARAVAEFVAEFSGTDIEKQPTPGGG